MVTTETHQSQDLLVPSQNMDQDQVDPENQQEEDPASPSSLMAGLDPEKMSQGPVNAITVLTLLDKLVNMLDAVQENQHKMEVRSHLGALALTQGPEALTKLSSTLVQFILEYKQESVLVFPGSKTAMFSHSPDQTPVKKLPDFPVTPLFSSLCDCSLSGSHTNVRQLLPATC